MPQTPRNGEFVVISDRGQGIFDVLPPSKDSARILAAVARLREQRQQPLFAQTIAAIRGETVDSVAERVHRETGYRYAPQAFTDFLSL